MTTPGLADACFHAIFNPAQGHLFTDMYLNLVQIAEAFNVTEQTIMHWARKEKMPHVLDRGRILFEDASVSNWALRRGLIASAGLLARRSPAGKAILDMESLLQRGGIWRQVAPIDVNTTFEQILKRLPDVAPAISHMLLERIQAPKGLTIAPVGNGFALPHPSTRIFLGEPRALVALIGLAEPWLEAKVPDNIPVTRLLFFIASSPRRHVQMLSLLAQAITVGNLGRGLDIGLDDQSLIRALIADSQMSAPKRNASQ